MKSKGRKVEISFTHIGSGLTVGKHNTETNAFEIVPGDSLDWFTIAGKDGVFYPANAIIVGDKILVDSHKVRKPIYVRFAWNEAAMPNFFNKEGLPAVPFRTGK
jgi:sialate O-acetylesterase